MNIKRFFWRKPSVLPGFGISLGFTMLYLTVIVLLPLAALLLRPVELGWSGVWDAVTAPRVLAALRLSFGAAFIATIINAFFGMLVTWVLVRYRFPGRRLLDALVDLPFALPTAVAGIALSTLYVPKGWLGGLLEPLGIKVAFTPLGVIVALVFVGFPFIVRTVQPVLQEMDTEIEEAAASLGATPLQTFFRVILPWLLPALLTGFALALARAIGEYGSVIFIAGNMPMVSEIAPLLITIKLEEFDYAGATAIGVVMLATSFLLLWLINALQRWSRRWSVL